MNDSKKMRIASIKDEVRDFHPLLNILLRKLPSVTRVEYTHGPGEMGADFIFSKRHPILEHEQYVGVVAKTGKITQDISSIDRQIKECSLTRLFLGGKQKIRIDEIWVISTDTITNNAQQKIHEEYKSLSISFISGEQLISLLDKHYPDFWEDTTLHVGEYLSSIRTKNEEIDRQLSLIQVSGKGFYIDQDVFEFPRYERRRLLKSKNKTPAQVNIFETIQKNNFILVEGGAGSGKSKLLRFLINHYSQTDVFNKTGILPIWVSYKELFEQYESDFSSLIKSKVDHKLLSEINGDRITFLVCIDAFDEKNIKLDEQIDELARLVTNSNVKKNLKVVITSRYLSELDRSSALESEITRVNLAPLSMSRTLEFVKTLCVNLNIASRLIEDLKKSQLFREMPRSPIAAIILAKLINENPKDIPSSLSELYSQYIELILGRWEIDKGLETQKEYQALDNIMIAFSKYVLDYEIPFIPLGDASDIVKEYLANRNLDINPDELFEKIKNRCEIVSVDFVANHLTFKHRSFAEFFYAKHLSKTGFSDIEQKAFTLYWMNTVFFYLGVLKDAPEIIKKLGMVQPDEESGRWLKLINMPNYLLAAYATPYNQISDATTETIIEAGKLFLDIASREIDSPFAALSHMQLLQLMQYLVRENYSFGFFKQAIEDAAVKIDDNRSLEEMVRIYSLYFLNIAYIQLGEDKSFDILLKKYADKLPIDIGLAIQNEAKDLKERSSLMRKQDRRIRHLLKDNSPLPKELNLSGKTPLAQEITKLYENPIKVLPMKQKTN